MRKLFSVIDVLNPLSAPGRLRLVLALLVVVSHLSSLGVGRPAVFAFFVLSGYWVMKMYAEKYIKYGDVSVFYLSRFLRIFGPYFFAYLAFLVLSAAFLTEPELSKVYGLAVFGVASTGYDILGVSWSLDIELQFYLLVPLFFLLLAAFDGSRAKGIALLTACLLLAPFGWYLQLEHGIWTVCSYLPSFAIGAAIWAYDWRPSKRMAYLSLALFVAVGAASMIWEETRPLLIKSGEHSAEVDWFGIAWTALLAPFFAYNVAQPSSKNDQHAGNLSYALYITHWPVVAAFAYWFGPIDAVEKGATFATIVAVTAVFYVLIDRPCENFRKFAVARRLRTRTA